jgi:hypothetical protein
VQDNVTTLRYVINPLKVWNSSSIGEHPEEINIREEIKSR